MKDITSYRYKVLNHNGQWEEWTGSFYNLREAKEWYRSHGTFHEYRGYKLQLFGKQNHKQEIPIN